MKYVYVLVVRRKEKKILSLEVSAVVNKKKRPQGMKASVFKPPSWKTLSDLRADRFQNPGEYCESPLAGRAVGGERSKGERKPGADRLAASGASFTGDSYFLVPLSKIAPKCSLSLLLSHLHSINLTVTEETLAVP